jgi:hypothetical protein
MDDILKDASKRLRELCRILNHAENHGCRDVRQQIESAHAILREITAWHKKHQEEKKHEK